MSHVRAVFRLILLALSLTTLFLVWLIGDVVLSAFPLRRRRWRNRLTRWKARTIATIIGMRIILKGEPPAPPFCLVSNHLSYVDSIAIMAHIQGVMIAKSEVASWPVIGAVSRRIGTVFINRETARDVMRVNDIIASLLTSGDGIAFFPEGTTTDGSAVGRFKSSLLNYPAKSSYPVHYAAVRYVTASREASERVCWWGDMPFASHVYHLTRLSGFTAEVHFGVPPVMATDRKQLTAELQSRVEDLFHPVH